MLFTHHLTTTIVLAIDDAPALQQPYVMAPLFVAYCHILRYPYRLNHHTLLHELLLLLLLDVELHLLLRYVAIQFALGHGQSHGLVRHHGLLHHSSLLYHSWLLYRPWQHHSWLHHDRLLTWIYYHSPHDRVICRHPDLSQIQLSLTLLGLRIVRLASHSGTKFALLRFFYHSF